MKAISGKLTIGAGRPSGSWLMLLLLLAVLVPSVCLLWFMNQAVHNERLAVRQKLIEAYRVNLALVQSQVEAFWHQSATMLDAETGPMPPPALFAKRVRADLADSVICFIPDSQVTYPGPAPAPTPEPTGAAWAEAERLEAANPAAAAAVFSNIWANASSPALSTRAFQAQVRCLVKAGKKDEAVLVLTRLISQDELWDKTDQQWGPAAANAALLAVELLKDSTPDQARALCDRLKKRLLDYDDFSLSSPQRRFLMREVQQLYPDPALSQMLTAEDLAARCLEAGPVRAGEPVLRPTALADVWQFGAPRGQMVALYHTETLLRRMRGGIPTQLLPTDVTLAFLPPGKDIERPLLSLPAGLSLPGWRLALTLNDQRMFDTAAEQRIASYVWIGVLVFAVVIILAALALRLVRRQMALTQLRNDLVANVTHELKTPLSSMRLLVETLLNSTQLDEQKAREYLQLIAQENLRLSRLIDNFLTFSRMERNKCAFGFKEVPAAEIIEGAVAAMQERFSAPGCHFQTQVPPHLPCVVADPDAMVTALVNLLDNAYKYSGDEKHITLSAGAENGAVFFAVKDTGIGLSPRDTKRIFKRFYQVDQRLSRTAGGCGLGLSIVKFIVSAHHGSVRVESQPGHGSTFTISLPGEAGEKAI